MLAKLATIVVNTVRETVRQPIYGVLLWVSMFWIGFVSPSLSAYSLESGSDIKIMKDVSLATLLLYGLLASVFSATSVITREIESHTVLTVVSKPVSRTTFLLGKYLGVCAAVLVGFYLLSITLFMAARQGTLETASDEWDKPVLIFAGLAVLLSLVISVFGNYVYGWHFSSTLTYAILPLGTLALLGVLLVSPKWEVQSPAHDFGNMQLVYAVILAFCAVLVLAAFAVALSTRFSQVVTAMLCAGVYVLGLLVDYLVGRAAPHSVISRVLYPLMPNFQFFWIGDAITQDLTVTAAQVANVAGYAVLYAFGVLAVGVAMFQTREVD